MLVWENVRYSAEKVFVPLGWPAYKKLFVYAISQ